MRQTFTGTKELIFDKAIEIIASVGFENMSIRALANAVGIKAASVYSHFESKQEILNTIYEYYCHHMFDNRSPMEKSRKIMQSGDKDEIFNALVFDFVTTDQKKYTRMLLTTKIIFMRIFNDEQANRIFLDLSCTESSQYVKDLLDYGVSIGIIEPFDTDTYANFITGQIFFMGIKAFAQQDYTPRQIEEEESIKSMLKGFLPVAEQKE